MDDELRTLFVMLDKSGNSSVNISQMGYALNALGFTVPQDQLDAICSDCSEELTYYEFRDLVLKASESQFVIVFVFTSSVVPSAKDLSNAFASFDRKGSGRINSSELKYYVTQLGDKLNEEDAKSLIKILSNGSSAEQLGIEQCTNILLTYVKPPVTQGGNQ